MKYLTILASLLLFISCSENDINKNYKLKEYQINTKAIIELKNEINYSNRFELKKIGDDRILFNLSKSGNILMFNLEKGTVTKIETNIINKDVDAVKYESDNCQFIYNNILYNFNYQNKSIDSILKVPFTSKEFIIHNLYSENLFKYNSFYYLQYGNENSYNRIADYGLLFFNKDSSFKFIKSPDELKKYYIHYNDMCVDNIDSIFYYTYATTPFLHKVNLITQTDTSTILKDSYFIPFDTTKMTDMRYIYDYTNETTYNVKLLCSKSNIYIIQRYLKNNTTNFKLYQYDKNLNLVSEFIINHTVDPNYIFLENNKLNFISLKDKKIYEYEVD
ncbi:MAG: hypothetical protein E6Q89_02825 [Bacteroidia bacterium]|nr:MAG: hypothetical protein E6Q89_02825 [Bacteroidia bacterium]